MNKKQQVLKHKYDVNDKTIFVNVAFVGKKDFNRILAKSQKRVFQSGRTVKEPDEMLVQQKLLQKALISIENATNFDIKYLVEPGVTLPLNGKKLDDTFELNENWKEFICDNYNEEFFSFVFDASREATLYIQDEAEQELKNLPPGSGTKTK